MQIMHFENFSRRNSNLFLAVVQRCLFENTTLRKIFFIINLSLYKISSWKWSRKIHHCRIHHWRILWSSYRKLAWVGSEPTTTEFRSDALTNWAIKPWFQLALRVDFVQPLQFHCLFSVKFHFGYCLRLF